MISFNKASNVIHDGDLIVFSLFALSDNTFCDKHHFLEH